MKKVLMTLALVAVAATSAFAQLSAGAGYLSNTQKTSYTSGSTTTTDAVTSKGFYAGADYTFDLGQGLGVVAGLKGAFLFVPEHEILLGTNTSKSSEIYLAVPVLANYSYALGNELTLFAYAGPTVAFGLSSKTVTTDKTGLTNSVTTTDNYGEDSTYGRVNVFLGAGIGVDVMNTIRIKAGYDIGLLDRDNRDDYKINDAQWSVGVAYLF